MIVIVDFGMGNLRSIQSKLRLAKIETLVSSQPADIRGASKLILPGVGNFSAAMKNLRESGLADALRETVVDRGKPILGICLGMQLFTRSSEEGGAEGLGWVDAVTRRFDLSADPRLRIPHVGWNFVRPIRETVLFRGLPSGARFYFTHSYHVWTADPGLATATTNYSYDFPCAIERGAIHGTQFHPEKSHQQGLQVIENFARYA